MCTNPVKIYNPYSSSPTYIYDRGNYKEVSSVYRSQKTFMEVPCGKCEECRQRYSQSILQRAQIESMSSYVYMITLTYDNAHIPHLDFTCGSEIVSFYYADVDHISTMFKRLRNHPLFKSRDFRYLHVTEYGSEKFRPHHHILLFVGKKKDDEEWIKFEIEYNLRSLLPEYYSINKGTRKHPIYEKLFTPVSEWKNGKLYSTFSCDLVVNRDSEKDTYNKVDSEAIASAVSYIVGYLNKKSKYDEYIEHFLDDNDIISSLPSKLAKKLAQTLKCRAIYSKHFGFGFDDNGKKVTPSVSFYYATYRHVAITEFLKSVPKEFAKFEELYPGLATLVKGYRDRVLSHKIQLLSYTTLQSYLDNLDDVLYQVFQIFAFYFRKELHDFITYNHLSQDDYYLTHGPFTEYDDNYKNSVAYKYLRKHVDYSLSGGLPYFGFAYLKDNKYKYVPLCGYYKRYVVTHDDYINLYKKLNVRNFDEYVDSFCKVDRSEDTRIHFSAIEKHREQIHNENPYYPLHSNKKYVNIIRTLKNNCIFVPTFTTISKLLKF